MGLDYRFKIILVAPNNSNDFIAYIWSLDKKYVIPIPLKKPGLYYLAKEIDLRMKCLTNVKPEQRGKSLLGFGNMIHELWVDIVCIARSDW